MLLAIPRAVGCSIALSEKNCSIKVVKKASLFLKKSQYLTTVSKSWLVVRWKSYCRKFWVRRSSTIL